MKKRTVTNPFNVTFVPFDNYGSVIPGMNWHKITYNKETGQGTYILKMDPSFTEQREEFRENLTLGLIPALGKFENIRWTGFMFVT